MGDAKEMTVGELAHSVLARSYIVMPFRLPFRLCYDAIANYFILTGTRNARVASQILADRTAR